MNRAATLRLAALALGLLLAAAAAAGPRAAQARACGGQAAKHVCAADGHCRAGRVSAPGQGGLCGGNQVCCLRGSDHKCRSYGGRCGHVSNCAGRPASTSGGCPGNRNVVCCMPNSHGYFFKHRQPSGLEPDNSEPDSGVLLPGPVPGTGAPTTSLRPRLRPDSLRTGSGAGTAPAPASGQTLCFPLERASVQKPPSASSFASVRPFDGSGEFTRCHSGNDIYSNSPGRTVAMADGEVTNIFRFLRCSGGQSYAVMVFHPSLQMTVNYGEVNAGAINVRVGEKVRRGQLIGRVGNCGMLHIEFYKGYLKANIRWKLPRPSTSRNACKNQRVPDSRIVNGYSLLKGLYDQGAYCTGY